MRAVQVSEFGGPEVLQMVDLPDPTPHDGLRLIEVSAAGVNFADTHQTANDYLSPQTLPLVPGAEVVGTDADGQRVVALVQGGYAEKVLANPAMTFAVPDGIDDTTALALVLQGSTAWHLLRTCTRMAKGETVVVHAAAGGVGTLAVQLARAWGAGRIIATASSQAKRDLAISLGADTALDPGSATGDPDDLRDALLGANDGKPVDIVMEMTGGRVFDGSFAALAPFGRLVTYGLASRVAPTPVSAGALMSTSRSVSGFWLTHAARLPGGLLPAVNDLFALHTAGSLSAVAGGRYPLADARRAHEDLAARRTTGKLVLDTTA